MCGIFGLIGHDSFRAVQELIEANTRRGRDGFGMLIMSDDDYHHVKVPGQSVEVIDLQLAGDLDMLRDECTVLGNCRAEPTTEIVPVATMTDQQPYTVGDWSIVHNGTIANDKQLLEKYDLTSPTRIDSWVIAALLDKWNDQHLTSVDLLKRVVDELVGSYAIIAWNSRQSDLLFYATNYRPLYFADRGSTVHLSSVKLDPSDQLVQPYSYGTLHGLGIDTYPLGAEAWTHAEPRTLVVLSGGLDSTCVAAMLKQQGHEIELLHFDYSCRATGPEREAVVAIAEELDAPLHVIKTDIFKTIGNSRLMDHSLNRIDNGEAGAEQAIEWVPARNIILSSIAIGIAEAGKFDHIALGINLEESGGGYTDNVLDLYDGLNGLMQWMIGVNKRLSFISPVGHLMKHEIVAEGIRARAPFVLTWSCYNAIAVQEASGQWVHCGKCGPCFMRRTAFERNGLVDPVRYLAEEV